VARLSGFRPDAGAGAGTLRFSTQAVIWQATGEDWNAVQLTCSTARPGRLSTPPLLSDDVLSSRRKPEPRTVVAEVRETEVQTSGLGSAQAASELPGVDDGGDPLSFVVSQPISVPSTGRPFRAPLTGFDCPATGGYLCMPERLPLALLRVNLVNRGARPILAGPVVLYRDGGYVGRSQVAFVASQERFRLSFGSLNGVRVRRNQQVKREETRLTGFQTITLKLELDLSNHSDEPVSLELVERIPVSELEDVKVTLSRGAPGRVDGDGMVSWNVALEPGAMLSQELEVKIEAPARVSLPY
jgi:uncharacterized protein (TIGR02231 family)